MGYVTYLSGELSIDPPLVHRELVDSAWTKLKQPSGSYYSVRIDVRQVEVDTDQGKLFGLTADKVVPYDLGEGRHGPQDVALDVGQLIGAFPGHTFNGRIDYEGEHNLDVARVIVKGEGDKHEISLVRPEIRWPDE